MKKNILFLLTVTLIFSIFTMPVSVNAGTTEYDNEEIIMGDFNFDGVVDRIDRKLLYSFIYGEIMFPDKMLVRAETDDNDIVNMRDYINLYGPSMPVEVPELIAYGNCGNRVGYGGNVAWILYSDGRLQLIGAGDTAIHEIRNWGKVKTQIKTIEMDSEITSIAANLFEGITNVTTVSLSVKSIGNSAFKNCISLVTVHMENTETIGEGVFEGCSALENIYYAGTKNEWNDVKKSETSIPNNLKVHCFPIKTETIVEKSNVKIYTNRNVDGMKIMYARYDNHGVLLDIYFAESINTYYYVSCPENNMVSNTKTFVWNDNMDVLSISETDSVK